MYVLCGRDMLPAITLEKSRAQPRLCSTRNRSGEVHMLPEHTINKQAEERKPPVRIYIVPYTLLFIVPSLHGCTTNFSNTLPIYPPFLTRNALDSARQKDHRCQWVRCKYKHDNRDRRVPLYASSIPIARHELTRFHSFIRLPCLRFLYRGVLEICCPFAYGCRQVEPENLRAMAA
jgi:hypothetical protein